jgi:hypothetical protein
LSLCKGVNVKTTEMRSKAGLFILCFLGFQGILLSAPGWLQYKTSLHTQEEFGSSSMNYQNLAEKPGDIKFPAFDGSIQYFAKWQHAMDDGKFRWVAFDRTTRQGPCNILYIDSNGDGNLADEKPYKGVTQDRNRMYFGPVAVYFKGEDGPVTYHLTFMFCYYDQDSMYWGAMAGCWYEGDAIIDGKTTRIALCDYNANGTFSDKGEKFDSDRIYLKSDKKWNEYYVGNYLELEDKLYHLSVAKDGAFYELNPAPELTYGTVKIADNISAFSAGGVNGFFQRTPKDGLLKLPEGSYKIHQWKIERKDDKGKSWSLTGSTPPNFSFVVSKEKTVDLDIGEPVFSQLTSQSKDNTYYFNQELRGKLNERVSLNVSGNRPDAPSILIHNKTGDYDKTFKLEYG